MPGDASSDSTSRGKFGCVSFDNITSVLTVYVCCLLQNEGCTYFGHLWTVFQPILFGLIGAEVSLEELQPATIGLGLAVLAIGLALRIIASFFVVFGLGLSLREKLFIPFAWLPKATVQVRLFAQSFASSKWLVFWPFVDRL